MPAIEYGNGQVVTADKVRNGAWNLESFNFIKPASGPGTGETEWVQNIAWCHCPVRVTGQTWNVTESQRANFERECTRYLAAHGLQNWKIRYPGDGSYIDLPGFRTQVDEARSLEKLKANFIEYRKEEVKLVFMLLDRRDAEVYNAIKQAADVVGGVHTVCVAARKPPKQQRAFPTLQLDGSTFGNILMKVNLRMGGVNSRLQSTPTCVTNATMFVGLDVTHPSGGGMEDAPSVAAAVATYNSDMAQWPASLRQQQHWSDGKAQEIILDLVGMMVERLKLWLKHNNNVLPEQIIIYRDGLSEGQFQQCINDELKAIEKAITAAKTKGSASSHPTGDPKLLLICAVKRHHHRFYPQSAALDDSRGNPRPGICVEGGITCDPGLGFDNWFSQSHEAIKGTARPAHYLILHKDERMLWTLEDIQTMVRSVTDPRMRFKTLLTTSRHTTCHSSSVAVPNQSKSTLQSTMLTWLPSVLDATCIASTTRGLSSQTTRKGV